jgi:LAGLIDADG endonuclease
MLENPVYPALPRSVRQDVYHGDNVTGAENQQERLIEFRGWVIGFVDGEGCFSIGFVRQPSRPSRVGYRTGFQVAHEFAVTQGEQSLSCLHDLREFFGIGQVIVNRRYDNHHEHLHRYVVRRRVDLLETVITVLPGTSDAELEARELREVRAPCRADRRWSPPVT